MITPDSSKWFEYLYSCSAHNRVSAQKKAIDLLFEKYPADRTGEDFLARDNDYLKLRELLSEASLVFPLSPVQQDIYHGDSGTAFVPAGLKKLLLRIRERFVVRPGTLTDLQIFVRYAFENRLHYSIRGAGTWPFGGSIPLNQDIILDLSHLDFFKLDNRQQLLLTGPGVIFADVRKHLKEEGFALLQDITNPHSGTICGWIATGGLGIGAYKYGHVKNTVEALLLLKPDGEWITVTPADPLFGRIFGSEGQLGIITGAVLKVRRLSFTSKPYAFSFPDAAGVTRFIALLEEWKLKPSSILYFDPNYIITTRDIERKKSKQGLQDAIDAGDTVRMARVRQELDVLDKLSVVENAVVLEFDSKEDYQKALKFPVFSSSPERRRYRDITYSALSTVIAHKLWDHRYQPVEMKPLGPSMLVSESIIPLDRFPEYLDFIQSAITTWTGNPVKTEGHVLNPSEMLLQTIILADTQTLRHKLYLGLVPFMTQTAMFHGGHSYGVGIWNLPFLKGMERNGQEERIQQLSRLKNEFDPHYLLNQNKFINSVGRRWSLRLFKEVTPLFLQNGVKLIHAGKNNGRGFSFLSLGRLLWKGSKTLIPKVVPPDLQASKNPIWQVNSACAECDSCERVCPTSDVFGILGVATPISRRKIANRLARNEKISRQDALGFLVCTRCDNCTRVCPTNIPLTNMFDMAEQDTRFQLALGLNQEEKEEFIGRSWEIMKESPLYLDHTRAEQKESRSHLEHGLNIIYPKGFSYAKLFIDPETCIRCGMCAHENACTYGARHGNPREIPELIDENCALCNACINYCPQNKAIQLEREFTQKLIANAVDLEEKKYWENQNKFLRDTTIIQRSPDLTEMADIYVTEDILMEIDREASTGQIPVSGMGQGDRHMSIGFGAERFSHFHIVGPAQNRLHEGDPDEELSVKLGRRHRYCKFDEKGNLDNPPFPAVKLKSPILYNAIPLESNGRVELAFLKVAEKQHTLVFMEFNRFLEHYDFFRTEGQFSSLPRVIVPRMDQDLIAHMQVHPHISRELLMDLWQMPMFEVEYHEEIARTINFIRDSVMAVNGNPPLLCGYLSVSEHDIIGGMEILPHIREKIEDFLAAGTDVLHVEGLRNKDSAP